MKVTKSYLKQVIKEELQKINKQQEIEEGVLGNLFAGKDVRNMMSSAKNMLEKENLQGVCSTLGNSPEFRAHKDTLQQIVNYVKSLTNYTDLPKESKREFGQKCFNLANSSAFKLLNSQEMRNFEENEKRGSQMGNLIRRAVQLLKICHNLSPSAASK